MAIVLKSEKEAREFFLRAIHTNNPCEIILYHNQRNTVHKILEDTGKETRYKLIDKDISDTNGGELGSLRLESVSPHWLKEVFENQDKVHYIVYMREFHMASDKVQDAVLNIIAKREIEGLKFPPNTMIILGVQDEDEIAGPLSGTHSVKFYRSV
jgi:hypothetical protein